MPRVAALAMAALARFDPALTPILVVIGLICLAILAVLYRPLLFCSISPETAAARGVPVRLVGLVFIVVMAVGVAEAAQVVGVLLSTALLIGPAAASSYILARPGAALALAVVIGVLETWLGIVLAYDTGWPVGFFISTIVGVAYVGVRIVRLRADRGARRTTATVEASAVQGLR